MKFLIWLRAGCITAAVLLFAFIGFWTWARDDLFAKQLRLSAPPQGPHRAAVVADFDLQGDGNHIIGVHAGQKWLRLTELVTGSEFPDQKWQLLWSRDGSLVALQQSAAMSGNPRVKTAFYSHAFDFTKNKRHEALDSWDEKSFSPFSRAIETLMKKRGGALAGRETRREVGVWRWEDAGWKRFYHGK